MAEVWELLFKRAIDQLKQGNVSKSNWSFGGGTVLKHMFNHRDSQDIDIFFRDAQLLTFVSPRINDANEAILENYSESSQFVRMSFPEGEVDFIVGRQVSRATPRLQQVLDQHVYVDQPTEIIAKKMFYRGSDFTPRDVFDLATVYAHQKDTLRGGPGCSDRK